MNPEIQKEFLEAYETYSDAIFRYCYFQTSNREQSLDLAQDVFTKAWEYLSSGKEVTHMKAFLYRIATNAVIDWRRKKKAVSLDKMVEEGFDVRSGTNEIESKEIFFEAKQAVKLIGELDEKYREVLLLRYVDELSIKEIAEIVGETENNVSVRIHRGLEKIKQIFKDKQNG
jgi:RNA polymerase sigma-70 factor (ECF subfamily)